MLLKSLSVAYGWLWKWWKVLEIVINSDSTIAKLVYVPLIFGFLTKVISSQKEEVSFWPHLRENHYTDDGGDHHHIFGGAHMEDLFSSHIIPTAPQKYVLNMGLFSRLIIKCLDHTYAAARDFNVRSAHKTWLINLFIIQLFSNAVWASCLKTL